MEKFKYFVKRMATLYIVSQIAACNQTLVKNRPNSKSIDPAYCGTVAISYNEVNAQVLARNCTSCHFNGGNAFSLTSYEEVQPGAEYLKDAVLGNRMPPGGPLGLADKQMFVAWVNQGAPLRAEDANLNCTRVLTKKCVGCIEIPGELEGPSGSEEEI